MAKIGILTCERLPDLHPPDQVLINLLFNHGHTAEAVIWSRKDVHWRDYDLLVIRNTWDYYLRAEDFRQWLDDMEKTGVRILNPVEILRSNMHKFYLREFEKKGIRIIPTLFSEKESPLSYQSLRLSGWEKIIIKPAMSAGSHQTEIFHTGDFSEARLHDKLNGSDWLVQPYLKDIEALGEISMIFFSGKFSHAVLKKPKEGDFRVQSQFGGAYTLTDPGQELISTALDILHKAGGSLLYARVDGILINGDFFLMELELIEPDLYFQLDPDIAVRFSKEILRSLPTPE